jgi:cysteine-rich repeat protein
MQKHRRWVARTILGIVVGVAPGVVAPVLADQTSDARSCRKSIGSLFAKVATTGFSSSDGCHKLANKTCAAASDCNDLSRLAFDLKGKYAAIEGLAATAVDHDCALGNIVLPNYTGGDVGAPHIATYPLIDELVQGNSLLVLGSKDLNCNTTEAACSNAIAKSRTKLLKSLLKSAVKCQEKSDASATTFGAIDPSCVDPTNMDPGGKDVAKAQAGITKGCGATTGGSIGACGLLPGSACTTDADCNGKTGGCVSGKCTNDCVTDAVLLAAQGLATDFYHSPPPPPPCGNGVVDPGEQCDDGVNNGTPGDQCNTSCELVTGTCFAAITGHRMVQVSLNTPQTLAGVEVTLNYPHLESSIPGTGSTSPVRSRLTTLQSGGLTVFADNDENVTFSTAAADPFVNTGPLFQVNFDACAPLAEHICNRNQQVVGCCPEGDPHVCYATGNDQHYDPVSCACGAYPGSLTAADCTLAGCLQGPCVQTQSGQGNCQLVSTAPSATACTADADCTTAGLPGDNCRNPKTFALGAGFCYQPCGVNADCTAVAGDVCHGATSCVTDADCGGTPGSCLAGGTCAGSGECVAPCTVDSECPTAGHCLFPAALACVTDTDCPITSAGGGVCQHEQCQSVTVVGGVPATSLCQSDLNCANAGVQQKRGCARMFKPPLCTSAGETGQLGGVDGIQHFPLSTLGSCDGTLPNGPIDGCPGDNSCRAQVDLTNCNVVQAVDQTGTVVPNVTCTVSITETP